MRPRTLRLTLAIISILAGLSLAATTSAISPASHEDELLRNATLVFEHAVETPASAIPAAVLMRAEVMGAAHFILVAQTQRGLDCFLQGRVRNTATHSIEAGPLGHNAPVRINADLLAYMKFENYLAGVTIERWVLQDISESNAVLYGRPYSTDDIVRGAGFFHNRGRARMWRDALAAYFREMS